LPNVEIQTFLREYSEALNRGNAAVFAGAGLSRSSGFLDWPGLLTDIARDVGLVIERETDLPAVAQYNLNKHKTRAAINQAIVNEFTTSAQPSDALNTLARLPVRTYWTTNYDTLIEDAIKAAGRTPDVKRRPEDLATSIKDANAIVYKMHGDITEPASAVVTKEDYETYELERSLFTTALQGDIVEKTFLFVGLSFTDPNIESVLARIRRLLGKNQRRHFVILRRPQPDGQSEEDYKYLAHRFQLRIDDLGRYSIYPVLIDDFAEIPSILAELERLNRATRVFVSGAALEFSPLGEQRIHHLCTSLGARLVAEGYTLVSGYGLGLGGAVVLGAAEAFERYRSRITHEQLRYRPFPQELPPGTDRADYYTSYRMSILSDVGIAVFICGNRLDPDTGRVETSPGVLEEFDLALDQGAFPIPLGATGHAARQIWEKMYQSPEAFSLPPSTLKDFSTIGTPESSDDQILESLFRIISEVRQPRLYTPQAGT